MFHLDRSLVSLSITHHTSIDPFLRVYMGGVIFINDKGIPALRKLGTRPSTRMGDNREHLPVGIGACA